MESISFSQRHIGPNSEALESMLQRVGYKDLDSFLAAVVPSDIFDKKFPSILLKEECSEIHALDELNSIAKKNNLKRSFIGLGYYGTSTPALIKRQVLENPAWYTAYTPYQAEISQGRLEALFNFQTLITELTGLPIANASLLDEATAAAEAMAMSFAVCKKSQAASFLVDSDVLPQTLAVLRTRAEPLGIKLIIANPNSFEFDDQIFGILLQLPGRSGCLWDPTDVINQSHEFKALVTVAIDPLAQVLIAPVGHMGADIAIGSLQRFGLPMSFGGPHAAFYATRETYKRSVPGRLVGKSFDAEGQPALRLALQTREQHIRRDKATSNICTAQVLLAVIASFYAIHHGPEGLEAIAKRVFCLRLKLENGLKELGYELDSISRFDCIEVNCSFASKVIRIAEQSGFNLRILPLGSSSEEAKGFGVNCDELTTDEEVKNLLKVFADAIGFTQNYSYQSSVTFDADSFRCPLRKGKWLQQSIFHLYRSETELLRYLNRLESRDFSLLHGMIPLGSCTMKLNAASELLPISWPEFSDIHPFSPCTQTLGYQKLISDLQEWLAFLTGFSGVSLQPNAGSQGEFAGLLVIKAWHESQGNPQRNICLIPVSAHGTNPASSVMAGLRVVSVNCDDCGNIDLNDLQIKLDIHSDNLAAIMITYPSTHGVFEPKIRDICELVHAHGGQVYLDGANLNAQLGLCRPGAYGADVCHLNLHKTFCIPHGGGGPGVGPIAVAKHLKPFLPGHPLANCGGSNAIGAVSAAPWGSAGILSISWMYLRMMGFKGLQKASSVALLSANYIAICLDPYYPVLFRGEKGLVAHECILDLRPLKKSTGIEVDDIAKRLMDYGFHAPTVSWPVAGTLMVEPTESESLEEIQRFCDAMIAIREEVAAIYSGKYHPENNPLKRAPHTLSALTADDWDRPYSRSQAGFPLHSQHQNKFWPAVARIDNAFGDRNLVCSCPPLEDLVDA